MSLSKPQTAGRNGIGTRAGCGAVDHVSPGTRTKSAVERGAEHKQALARGVRAMRRARRECVWRVCNRAARTNRTAAAMKANTCRSAAAAGSRRTAGVAKSAPAGRVDTGASNNSVTEDIAVGAPPDEGDTSWGFADEPVNRGLLMAI